MQKITLHTNWRMHEITDDSWYDATVPGSVINDLCSHELLPDPYYRDNELLALSKMEQDYEYQCEFSVDSTLLECDEILLRFEGIDTLADITLNGTLLGTVSNMHRIYEYPVTTLLTEEGNQLNILFHSPVKYIQEAYQNDPVDGTEDAMKGFIHLRKAHYMFGWDWGPRIPDAGIFRPVSLIGIDKARLSNVKISQKHSILEDETEVELSIDVMLLEAGQPQKLEQSVLSSDNSYQVQVTIETPEENLISGKPNQTKFLISKAKLWWPNGYGEQPLYTITIDLFDNTGRLLDTCKKRIGLRTMTMHRQEDEYGESFAHEVNGIAIFAMGADYIPEDNILCRTSKERTRELLTQCKEAHFNCIRVWGGGLYPADDFYDICDELGLIVWQDFMFACGNYRFTKEFETSVTQELIDNIRRIRHHACLGLWCGNNEMELFTSKREWNGSDALAADYIKMYEYVFPNIVEKEDPNSFYWPASPSSGGHFDNPNDENRGDVHYWEVWHGDKPFTEYRKYYFRYLSEFGFQSFPSLRTIESFTKPEDRNVFSYVMEKHQRNAAANGKIMNYMEQMFLYPNSFDTLIYASQLLQAEAIRYGVEHFRRNRGRCMGCVYWQLNDCWPVASWSSIDYYGRWKALHYYAKRFFAPILLSCEEEGLLSQSLNVNAEPFDIKKSIRLNVSNETRYDETVTIRCQVRDAAAEIIEEDEITLTVNALSSKWMDAIQLPDLSLYEHYVSYQLIKDGQQVSEGTVLFCPPKYFHFEEPSLLYRIEDNEIVIFSDVFAKSVEIRNKNDDLILSDNFFDLNGRNEEKRVTILKGEPDGITIRSVYDIR